MDRHSAFLYPLVKAYIRTILRHPDDSDILQLTPMELALRKAIDQIAVALGLAVDTPFGASGEALRALFRAAYAETKLN